MTTHAHAGHRRLRAAVVGLGLDASDDDQRIITGRQCLVVGGSAETHAELLETMLRLESELDRLGVGLGDMDPFELAELAWRIDSPELLDVALRLNAGLASRGRHFHEATAEELTELSAPAVKGQ
ncbi:MAG: hypothetical protein U0800_22810 [Isosphaeraceae bacterium]